MKTFEIIMSVIFCWFFIGWLFAILKTKFWYNFLIKKEYADKFYDFEETPWRIILPILIIFPIQTINWLCNPYKNDSCNRQKTIPIIPFGASCRKTKSNINYAAINAVPTYLSFVDNYGDGTTLDFNEKEFIKEQFGFCVLIGGFHLISWLIGILGWVVISVISLVFLAIQLLGKLFSFTYPSFNRKKKN